MGRVWSATGLRRAYADGLHARKDSMQGGVHTHAGCPGKLVRRLLTVLGLERANGCTLKGFRRGRNTYWLLQDAQLDMSWRQANRSQWRSSASTKQMRWKFPPRATWLSSFTKFECAILHRWGRGAVDWLRNNRVVVSPEFVMGGNAGIPVVALI